MQMQMTAEEHTSKETIFKHEVCMTHCKLCASERPEFCMFFLANLGKKYFTRIMLLIKIAHERKPKLIEGLKTFEGFTAIFCNSEVCQFSSGACNLGQKLDCYQMFLTQSKQQLEEGEASKLAAEWDGKLFRELCRELDDIGSIVNSMNKKKRKRLFKIGTRVIKMMDRWRNPNASRSCSHKLRKTEKKVNTTLFYNDDEKWAAKIKLILEGGNQLEDSNRK